MNGSFGLFAKCASAWCSVPEEYCLFGSPVSVVVFLVVLGGVCRFLMCFFLIALENLNFFSFVFWNLL